MTQSAGLRFRQALANSKPLQIVGTTNAYFALMAEQTGFKPCIYRAQASQTPPTVYLI